MVATDSRPAGSLRGHRDNERKAEQDVDRKQIEIECSDQEWLIAEWPDGTWCDLGQIREMTHVSDDFQIMRVLTHDEGYTPIKTTSRREICK